MCFFILTSLRFTAIEKYYLALYQKHMKVLELNFEKSWRGGERQTLYNMQGFRNAGIQVELVCRKGSALEKKAAEDDFTSHSFSSVFGVIFFLISKGKNFQFIHAQTSHILTYCVFTKVFHGVKVIFTRRVNFAPKGFFTKLKYNKTDKVIAISNEIKNTLSNFCGRNDIEVISDIVVKENNNPGLTPPVTNKLIVGTVSALTFEKDPFTMIDAVKELSQKRSDFIFLHYGEGEMKEQVAKKILKENLQHVYFLMGFTENIGAFYNYCDVFVMTSKEEGLGSSVLDAFINKVAVVSTNAGGLKELLADDRGILCKTGDNNAITNGIDLLLSDEIKRSAYIDKAYKYVTHFHSMEYITQQYISVIKK